MLPCSRLSLRSPTANNKLSNFFTNQISSLCKNPALKMESQPNSKRPTCPACSKPLALCLCARLKTPHLDNQVHITILQHSLEKKHPLNSARIAKLGLRNVDVFTVSDVNFDAQFVIRPLELGNGLDFLAGVCMPGVCGNASESLESGDCLEDRSSRKRDFDDISGGGFVSNLASKQLSDCQQDDISENVGFEGNGREEPSCVEPVVNVTVEKYGKISSISHPWKLLDEGKKPKSEHLFDSQEAVRSLGRGFVVTKIQKQRKGGGLELEHFEEFEIKVPPGSALLFPAQKSVPVEAVDFEVKNLIVLDGTWAKANRMYNENPWLRVLPCVKLDVEKISLFSEVRHQPKPGYLSTIESIVYALKALGGRENLGGLDHLLEVFESMVEDQRRCKDERLSKVSSV